MGQEIELKLAIPAQSLRALTRHPLIAAAERPGRAQTLHNTYFDTPDLLLQQAGIALRTRRAGRRILQTVKCAGVSVGGLSTRPEWEQAFGGEFDFSGISDPATRKLLRKHATRIEPAFDTTFRRETRIARPQAGVEIALMIDTGFVRAGGREMPIRELELELYAGTPLQLVEFALQLCADLPMLPAQASKAERGYRLYTGTAPRVARARATALAPGQTPLDAFRAIAFDCIDAWQANAESLRALGEAGGGDHEPAFVHQLRVALRRLRSMLRAFSPVLPEDFVAHWNRSLGMLADQVGAARDLDVLRDTILSPVPAIGSAAFATPWQASHNEALRAVRATLDDPAHGQLPLRLTRDLLALPDEEPDSLRRFATRALRRLVRQAQKAHAAATGLDAPAVHALRIRYKRLRYALECFAPLFPGAATRRHLDRLVTLLDDLGYLNDVDVAGERLAQWAGDDAASISARAYVLGWHGPRVQTLRSRLLKRSAILLHAELPWKNKKDKPEKDER